MGLNNGTITDDVLHYGIAWRFWAFVVWATVCMGYRLMVLYGIHDEAHIQYEDGDAQTEGLSSGSRFHHLVGD